MKRSLKPILIFVGTLFVLALIVAAVIFFIPRDNTSFSFECFRLRLVVSDFLKDVKCQRLDDAFDRIYCTSPEDGTPIEGNENCRQVWIDRVSALRIEDNTYLENYSDLKVRKSNGEFVVTVKLSVLRQGYNDLFYANENVLRVVYDKGWKIASLSEYDLSLQTDLEKALSGSFTPEELAESET